MPTISKHDILSITDFESLVQFLSDKLDWPIDLNDVPVEDLAFDYTAAEIGIPEDHAAKVHDIKQLRPLVQGQPWGIFYIDFEPKSLPVTVLRRILNAFVQKKRAQSATRSVWALDDLLFVATHGDIEQRGTTVARFTGTNGSIVMREFTWNAQETEFTHLTNYLNKLHWPGDPSDHAAWRSIWQSAFVGSKRKAIQDSKDLAEEMAAFARDVRLRIRDHLRVFKSDKEPLRRLFNVFKNVLIHGIDEDGFADMYAQTIAYGLFTARVSHPEGEFDLQRAVEWLPETNPFLKDLFRQCFGLSGLADERVDIEEIGIGRLIELFQDLSRDDLKRILDEFGSKTGDPVIHFYEGFLEAYDRKIKFQRGVFYTPDPVVSYIVRSVHKILQQEFGLELGLADTATWQEMKEKKGIAIPEGVDPQSPLVQILDPAAGTGTFLKHTIELIHKTMMDKWTNEGKTERDIEHLWNEYVSKHLLTRLYGIELMPAPYAVCHMKLGLVLRNLGYEFKGGIRLQVYLANALDGQAEDNQLSLAGQGFERAIVEEARAAQAIKGELPILVVIGNPPYKAISANENDWIDSLIADYKLGISERNNLGNDYVKFLRFSQWRINRTGHGIVGMITANSFLDGLVHRSMRSSLLYSFSSLYILNLHGNANRKEFAPDGTRDGKVFDIKEGVAISILLKDDSSGKRGKQMYADLFGSSESKYAYLKTGDVNGTTWIENDHAKGQTQSAEQNFFIPFAQDPRPEYSSFVSLQSIFLLTGPGMKAERDHIVRQFSYSDIQEVVNCFRVMDEESLRVKYELGSDSRDWKVASAKRDTKRPEYDTLFHAVYWHPFDIRHTWYSGLAKGFVGTPGTRVLQHMLKPDNLSLLTTKQTKDDWCVLATNLICGHKSASRYDITSVMPLYLYSVQSDIGDGSPRKPNLSAKFVAEFAGRLGLTFVEEGAKWVGAKKAPKELGPEDIFNYIYAVFHSPTYRERYKEFLKIDFPRVPLTSSVELFSKLVPLGYELVQYHLLEHPNLEKTPITFPAQGTNKAEKIAYDEQHERVYINKTQYFDGIRKEVWEFHIGGYQVCDKWLKDRAKAKRTLSQEDVRHYQKTVMALSETIRLMQEIDDAIPGWPIS